MQLFGSNGTTLTEVDPTQKAARVTNRPQECLTWLTIAGKSGLVATPAAGATLFSFRNAGTNNIMLRRVGMGVTIGATVTTAQALDYAAYIARAFTASDTGGTALTYSGNNGRHRTSFPALSFGGVTGVVGIASTTALVAGTRTVDTQPIGYAVGSSGTTIGTVPIVPQKSNLLSHDDNDYPVILAPNEGLVIQAVTAQASGSIYFYADIEVAELTTSVF